MKLYQLTAANGTVAITRRIISNNPVRAMCAWLNTTSKEDLLALKGAPLRIAIKPLEAV